MVKMPFIIVHNGVSIKACAEVDPGTLAIRDMRLFEAGPWLKDGKREWRADPAVFDECREKVEFLNDLLHSGAPFEMLATCRRARNMFGAITNAAALALEALRDSLSASLTEAK